MSRFEPQEFFTFTRTWSLWQEGESVWMALQCIENFFEKHSFSIDIDIPPTVFLDRPETISIGEGTILEPGAYIQGPCILGKHCRILHGAYLRGGVICGDRCVIGHGSEIKHSILLDGAHVAHLNYVGDSILGHRVNLGAGVKCANLRLDRREVVLHAEGEKIKTSLKKFGCVIGDDCQIGCNTVINPGTLIGPQTVTYPLLNLHGVIPGRKRVKGKSGELDLASYEVTILEALRQP